MRLATLAFLLFLVPCAMGYDIHITRRSDWSDKAGPAITLEEWKKLVASDSEMRLDGFAEASTSDGKKIRIEREGLSVWIKPIAGVMSELSTSRRGRRRFSCRAFSPFPPRRCAPCFFVQRAQFIQRPGMTPLAPPDRFRLTLSRPQRLFSGYPWSGPWDWRESVSPARQFSGRDHPAPWR
jgi:hypothetical protein